MADAWGIDDGYFDVSGAWHETSEQTRRALRVAMGGLPDLADPPPNERPVWFVHHGEAPEILRPADLVLEDGTSVGAEHRLPPDLPIGYHDLVPNDGGPTTRLIVTPARCHSTDHLRTWGWAVQLYATRSRESWGIGDLADLRRLGAWAAGQGAGVVAVNPLHAPLPIAHQQASPYSPSSRRFRSPLYLRVEEVPGFDSTDPTLSAATAAGRALLDEPTIDRDRVHAVKMKALSLLWSRFVGDAAFTTYRAAEGAALERYATFCTISERYGCGWSSWPGELRRPEGPAVARFAAANTDRVGFHAWLQWLLDVQLAAAGATVGLLGDLAVGVDPDGADAWVWQDVLARGVRIGAPPDEFNQAGQDWGLPPFVPWKLRAAGYEPLAVTLRSALRHCGGLRIDHVMGLFRLYWIPEGAGPRDGGYVRFPGAELLDIVALESVRAGATIVGEDLGTVEDEVRHRLHERGVLSYRVLWFEDGAPATYPHQALAAATTHDLPTIPGVWTGSDAPPPMLDRLVAASGAPPNAAISDVVVSTYAALAEAPSMIVLATLEDALGVTERPNLPGTTVERPNWSVPLPLPIEQIEHDDTVAAVAASLATGRDGTRLHGC